MFFFFKQKTAYEMRISDWSSDVCSSDLAVFVEFVAAHAQAHAEVGAHGLAYGGHDLYAESHAVFKRAAVFVIAEIGAGAPELVDQVLVGGRYFYAVHAGPLDALRGLGEVAHDAADFLAFSRFGIAPVHRFAYARRGDQVRPVLAVPGRAAPHVGDRKSTRLNSSH